MTNIIHDPIRRELRGATAAYRACKRTIGCINEILAAKHTTPETRAAALEARRTTFARMNRERARLKRAIKAAEERVYGMPRKHCIADAAFNKMMMRGIPVSAFEGLAM